MKIKNSIYLFLVLCLSTSCEDFLNVKPTSNVGENAFYQNAEQISSALIACYNGLQAPLESEWALTELRSENTRVYTRSSGNTTFKDMLELDIAQINTTNNYVSSYWSKTYNNIDRCNKVINSIDVVKDATLHKLYLGQALFIRSYHYFNLVRLWGGTFLITKTTTGEEASKMQRSTADEIYAQIESDLEAIVAQEMIPVSYPVSDLGRVTMVAAKALLGKVYATHYRPGMEEYARALTLFNEAIEAIGNPSSLTELVPYSSIFTVENEMNKEIIFAVRFKSGGLGLGNVLGNSFAPANSTTSVINGGGSGLNYPSDLVLRAYDSQLDEVRSSVNYAKGYVNVVTGEYVENDELFTRYIKKFVTPVTTPKDGDSDWSVIRVSDLLLMYAEVDNEINGPTARSVSYVNLIRERAKIGKLSNTKIANKYEFRDAVQDERKLELAFENHRWFDLLRMGKALDVVNRTVFKKEEPIYGLITTSTLRLATINDLVLPLPKNVMDINPNIAQNEGY